MLIQCGRRKLTYLSVPETFTNEVILGFYVEGWAVYSHYKLWIKEIAPFLCAHRINELVRLFPTLVSMTSTCRIVVVHASPMVYLSVRRLTWAWVEVIKGQHHPGKGAWGESMRECRRESPEKAHTDSRVGFRILPASLPSVSVWLLEPDIKEGSEIGIIDRMLNPLANFH